MPLADVEDVAEHTFEVAAIALLLTDELERRGTRVNRERALSMAVVHDWAEASIGDFPYPALKHLGPSTTKRRIEGKALEDLLSELPGKGRKYLGLWREYSEERTPEAKLVHASDYLSMLVQALKHRERGNRSRELEELWHAVERDLGSYVKEFPWMKELVSGLEKRFSGLV